MALYNVREEVVNVVLAELLEKRGLLSIPETIRRSVTQKNDRQLPDIIVADLADAKYFGAFYTTVPAATLLLKLTLDSAQESIDWSDLQ
jgi:hypothetical protein